MRLKGKIAIVTGGGGGIGSSIAMGLGKEGAKVVIADTNAEKAAATVRKLQDNGIDAFSIITDVSKLRSVQAMAKNTVDYFGGIDILVNNAGYFPDRKEFISLDLQEWDNVMAVNLKGAFLCIRAVFPHMKAQNGGKIINIASTSVFWGPLNNAPYIASKGGLIALSRALARELGQYNININCIAPGSTFSEDPGNDVALEFRRKAIPKRALQRLEMPEDLAGAATFLASPYSDFMTGQTLVVDGGHIMQ